MGYKLKPGQEEFTIVDGPLEGMNYKKGVEYPTAPQGYEGRFEYQEPVTVTSTVPQPRAAKLKDAVDNTEKSTTGATQQNKE